MDGLFTSPACAGNAAGGISSDDRPLRVLSLGAGVQSTTLLLMSIRGELPRIDHAIFADTQYEPPAVYRHLEWLKEEATAAGIPLHLVSNGNLRADAIAFRRQRYNEDATTGRRGYASIPLFVLNADGSQGMIRRQCTAEYKIAPIEQFIRRELLGLAPGERAPKHIVIEQWFGITWDESQRVRTSGDKWKLNIYPFCAIPEPLSSHFVRPDGTPRLWTREDCIRWLKSNYPEREVPRSACICCPYRSNEEWRRMRDSDPASWADAVAFDREIRHADQAGQDARKVIVGLPFIHRQMKPLDEVDLRDYDEKSGQLNIFGMQNECEGMCGV